MDQITPDISVGGLWGGGGGGVSIGAERGLFAKVYLATTTSPYYLQYVCISEEKV